LLHFSSCMHLIFFHYKEMIESSIIQCVFLFTCETARLHTLQGTENEYEKKHGQEKIPLNI